MAQMFTVFCKRTVTEMVRVEVFADDAVDAINAVVDGKVKVQWPDETFLSDNDNAVVTAYRGRLV